MSDQRETGGKRRDWPVQGAADPERLAARIIASHPALFLDYDGTLTPIMARPELARIDDAMRDRLRAVARRMPTAIVSGRDLADVKAMVGVEGLIYAGSHGFDIETPSGAHQIGEAYRPALARAATALKQALSGVDGVLLENKRFAVAIHTRGVADDGLATVDQAVRAVLSAEPELRLTGGKRIFEFRPNMPWDKGRAVLHLIDREGMTDRTPVYAGDDLTDEDAFAALADRGIGILVGDHGHATAATVRLPDLAQMTRLLDLLAGR